MTILARLSAFTAHDDPATTMTNLVALVVAWNGPFYPLFVFGLIDPAKALPSLLTMLSMPFFLAIPLLSRRSSRAARLALPVVGTVNTLWCIKLLGPDTAVGLFLLPCILLAGLLFRRGEGALLLFAASFPLAALFLPNSAFGVPLMDLTPAEAGRLAALNTGSVATFSFLLALQFASLLRRLGAGETAA